MTDIKMIRGDQLAETLMEILAGPKEGDVWRHFRNHAPELYDRACRERANLDSPIDSVEFAKACGIDTERLNFLIAEFVSNHERLNDEKEFARGLFAAEGYVIPNDESAIRDMDMHEKSRLLHGILHHEQTPGRIRDSKLRRDSLEELKSDIMDALIEEFHVILTLRDGNHPDNGCYDVATQLRVFLDGHPKRLQPAYPELVERGIIVN